MPSIEVANRTDAINVDFAVYGDEAGNLTPIPGASGNLNPNQSNQIQVSGYLSYVVQYQNVGWQGQFPAAANSPRVTENSRVSLSLVPIEVVGTNPAGIEIANSTDAPGVAYQVLSRDGDPIPSASGSLAPSGQQGWKIFQEVSGFDTYVVQFFPVRYDPGKLAAAKSEPLSGENGTIQLAVEVLA